MMVDRPTTPLPEYLARLDENQRAAALDTDGCVVIHACAGAGKTAVLAARAAYLLDSGICPEQILCLTFTNKAADEMRSRIESYSSRNLSAMWIGTYHSVCARILRTHGAVIGLPADFSIIDDAESSRLISQIIRESNCRRDVQPSELKSYVDRIKSQLSETEDPSSTDSRVAGTTDAHPFYRLYRVYQERLRSVNALDFGDLIRQTVKLLISYSDVGLHLSSQFRYVVVDEYQDSAPVEAKLVRLLSSYHGNLCVVGDLNQAIYSFKGSDYRLMADFESTCRRARTHILNRNYRSAKSIVTAAEEIISGDKDRSRYSCIPHREDPGQVGVLHFESDLDEASVLSTVISEAVGSGIVAYSDIAVLARARSATRTLQDVLRDKGVPVQASDKKDWLISPEIQRTLFYLRKVLDQDDDSLDLDQHRGRSSRTGRLTLERLTGMHRCGVAMRTLLEQTIRSVKQDLNIPYEEPNANLRDILTAGLRFPGSSIRVLRPFLESLGTDGPTSVVDTDAVRIMTIHQSKGSEFPVVFVLGLEEGILPCWHSLGDTDAVDEERRLCYVAMTRAKDLLYLSSCNCRSIGHQTKFLRKSRFLDGVGLQSHMTLSSPVVTTTDPSQR